MAVNQYIALLELLRVEVMDRAQPAIGQSDVHIKHLIEVTIEQPAIPGDGQCVTAHEAVDRGGVERVRQSLHVSAEVTCLHKPLEEARDRHVIQAEESVEGHTVVSLQRLLPLPL